VNAAVVVVIVVAFGAPCHENNGLWARKHACYFLVATEFDRLGPKPFQPYSWDLRRELKKQLIMSAVPLYIYVQYLILRDSTIERMKDRFENSRQTVCI
jgi:hypothetical protein